MNELALFAGAGGGLLASKLLGWRTVCYVEHNTYAVDVIKARIRDGYLDDAPIWDDCFTFDGYPWAGLVDVISAGFPCQPFSLSGRGLSENDPRNGWPAVKRILSEVRPGFAFLENVPGLISKPYIRRIFGDLAEIGLNAEWGCLSAAAVGANHKRDRFWIVAYPNSGARQLAAIAGGQDPLVAAWDGQAQSMAHADQQQTGCHAEALQARQPQLSQSSNDVFNPEHEGNRRISAHQDRSKKERDMGDAQWWAVEPRLGRVAHGVAHRVERLEAIGNGQVPEVARKAWELLTTRITPAAADVGKSTGAR